MTRVLERRVEQRREVDRPHHRREHDPRRDRVAEEPHDPRMEDRQDPAVAGRRRAQPQDEGDRRGQRQQRRRDQHQQHVLDHVDREQRGVVAADPGQEGEGQGQDAGEERDRPAARDRVRRVDRVDPPDRPQPPDGHGDQAEGRQRLERPAQQQRGGRWAVRPGRGRGRAPAWPAPSKPPTAPSPASDRWIQRRPGIGRMVARTARRWHPGPDGRAWPERGEERARRRRSG